MHVISGLCCVPHVYSVILPQLLETILTELLPLTALSVAVLLSMNFMEGFEFLFFYDYRRQQNILQQ